MNTGRHGARAAILGFGRACRRILLGAIVLALVVALGVKVSDVADTGPHYTAAQQAQFEASTTALAAASDARLLKLPRLASVLDTQAEMLALPGMKNDGEASPSPTSAPPTGGASPDSSGSSAASPTPSSTLNTEDFAATLMRMARANIDRSLAAPRETARLFAAVAASQAALARQLDPKSPVLTVPQDSVETGGKNDPKDSPAVCSGELKEPTLTTLLTSEYQASYAYVFLRSQLSGANQSEADTQNARHEAVARDIASYATNTCRHVPGVQAAYAVEKGQVGTVLANIEQNLVTMFADALSLTEGEDRARILQWFLAQAQFVLAQSGDTGAGEIAIPPAVGISTDDTATSQSPMPSGPGGAGTGMGTPTSADGS